ncbi:MAG: DinB family protein, partial [Thiomonas sp.]
MSTATLISLFAYKTWANSELFALLITLPEQQAEQAHTCIRTLNHIYVVDRLFRARLSGESSPFEATNTKATP